MTQQWLDSKEENTGENTNCAHHQHQELQVCHPSCLLWVPSLQVMHSLCRCPAAWADPAPDSWPHLGTTELMAVVTLVVMPWGLGAKWPEVCAEQGWTISLGIWALKPGTSRRQPESLLSSTKKTYPPACCLHVYWQLSSPLKGLLPKQNEDPWGCHWVRTHRQLILAQRQPERLFRICISPFTMHLNRSSNPHCPLWENRFKHVVLLSSQLKLPRNPNTWFLGFQD